MNYILSKINERINLLEAIGNNSTIIQHYQSRVEFLLIYLLDYLWNKNFTKLDDEDREFVIQNITKPSIGSIILICRKLDVEKNILKGKLNETFNKYPKIRNESIGHGYVFEDGIRELLESLSDIFNTLIKSKINIFSKNVDFIMVTSKEKNIFKGLNLKPNGAIFAWSCPENISDFVIGNLYGSYQLNDYFRLSPFLEITDFGNEFYIFSSIEENLTGRVRYNKLINTEIRFKEWDEFIDLNIVNDGLKVKSPNGTIRNVYDNNYKVYIDIGIKSKVRNFLKTNKASVCATIWGHGGVGKTATIQSLCEDLSYDYKRFFDYILFLSAKDRKYNYYTGAIEIIDDNISTFSELTKSINKILFNIDIDETNLIIEYQGKILIVIDDFETFPKEEKNKIENFISNLTTNHHKVIITTRAANIKIGQEYQTNELTKEETKNFLIQVIKNKEIGNIPLIESKLEQEENLIKLYDITGGRPLFIFQFAFILAQRGIDDALEYEIKNTNSAIDFLYGRIYEYLSSKAKDLFVVLSTIVEKDNLSNVVEKAQYILNLDLDGDTFRSALNELIKLKIIKIDSENHFFEIYSNEIYQIMSNYFNKRERIFKSNCISRRNQINKDKTLDVEHSLLLTANSNRLTKNEIEVIDSFKQILNRTTCPLGVKLQAVLNLAAYLVDRGKKEIALKNLDDYSYLFTNKKKYFSLYSKMWGTYYWANGTREQKNKAVKILLDYVRTGFDYNDNINLELNGMLLQYRSILIITDWQDLKEKINYNEISLKEFKEKRNRQKQECKDIYNKHGFILYNKISQIKLDEISSGARQNAISGLYNFIDVLIRLQKFELIKGICDFVIYNAPKNFHPQFEKKKNWIISIQYKKR